MVAVYLISDGVLFFNIIFKLPSLWIQCSISLPLVLSTSISGGFRIGWVLLRRWTIYGHYSLMSVFLVPLGPIDLLQMHNLRGKFAFYSLYNWILCCSSIKDSNYLFTRPLPCYERREPWVDWYGFSTIRFSRTVGLQRHVQVGNLRETPISMIILPHLMVVTSK